MMSPSSHGNGFGVATENIYPDIPSSPLSDVPSDFDNESGAEGPLPTKINPDVEPRPKDAVAGKQPAKATAEVSKDIQGDQEPSKTAAINKEHALEVAALAKLPTVLGEVATPPNITTADRQRSNDAPTIRRSKTSTTKSAKQQLLREEASARRESPRKTTPAKRQLPDAQECNVRPSRRKISSTRLGDELDEKKPSPKPEKSPSVRKRQPVRANWSASYLLQNAKSKLATVDLAKLLSHERAWTELSREQQLQLVGMLPDTSLPLLPEEAPLPNVPKEFVKSNNSFLADIRLFQEDLSAGRYEPQWQKDAKIAMERRAQGDFDDWKEKNREAFWGQKQKVQWMALAGESSQHSLQTLVAAGTFKVGDVWTLSRGAGHRRDDPRVEKEAKIVEISAANLLTFTFPPGRHKFSAPANGEDITITGVDGPHPLSNAILKEDGRITNRGGNSWKEFRCFRRNQDMGSLWDVREQYDRATRR